MADAFFYKSGWILGSAVSLAILFPTSIWSGCGIAYCSRPQPLENQNSFLIELVSRYTPFKFSGRQGSYIEIIPRLEYLEFNPITIAAHVPLIYLSEGEAKAFGLGNPMLYAEYRLPSERSLALFGAQLELPFGNHEDGMAGDHFMILPYVSAIHQVGNQTYLSGTFGTSAVLSMPGGHSEGGHPQSVNAPVVNPHADHELHYRTAVSADFTAWKMAPEIFLHGQYVISGIEKNQNFLSSGGILVFQLGKKFGIQANAQYHVSSPKRFEWRSGLGAKLGI